MHKKREEGEERGCLPLSSQQLDRRLRHDLSWHRLPLHVLSRGLVRCLCSGIVLRLVEEFELLNLKLLVVELGEQKVVAFVERPSCKLALAIDARLQGEIVSLVKLMSLVSCLS